MKILLIVLLCCLTLITLVSAATVLWMVADELRHDIERRRRK